MTREEAIAIAERIRNGERSIDETVLNKANASLKKRATAGFPKCIG